MGINPNEGNDAENGEMAQCSGETDDDTESEGDEGNEGETESSGKRNTVYRIFYVAIIPIMPQVMNTLPIL